MTQPPPRPGKVIATVRSLMPSLQPSERAVADTLLRHSDNVIEMSSQQVASLAGVSRATVVRACQTMGFTGYQQLRVLVARDAGYAAFAGAIPEPDRGADNAFDNPADGSADGRHSAVSTPAAAEQNTAFTIVEKAFQDTAASVATAAALLVPAAVREAVELLERAQRVVVIGNGLSAALAADAAARMTRIGRAAEAPSEVVNQQITARLLCAADVLLVISGSGTSSASLSAARAARAAGARIISISAFDRTELTRVADIVLVVTLPGSSFKEELVYASRVPQMILVEALVSALSHRMGESAARARDLALSAISDNLAE